MTEITLSVGSGQSESAESWGSLAHTADVPLVQLEPELLWGNQF